MKKLSLKTLLILSLSLFSMTSLVAQDAPDKPTKNYYTGFYTFAGIGPAIPLGGFGDNRTAGFDLNTAVSINYESGFLIRGMFDFSTFPFQQGEVTQAINGQNFDVEGSNNLITFNVGPGYHFKSKGRIAPYVFSGLGFSFVSNPVLNFSQGQNLVEITQEANAYFSTVLGGGLDYIINYSGRDDDGWKPFLFFFEAFSTYIPQDVAVSPNTFLLLTFNVGIKANI